MKISELIKLHGVPVKLTRPGLGKNNWVEIISDKRTNCYPCFLSSGSANVCDDYCDDWFLYVEPKSKKKLYGYLSKEIGTSAESIYSDSYVVSLLTKEFESKHMHLVRAPQFDCEIDI